MRESVESALSIGVSQTLHENFSNFVRSLNEQAKVEYLPFQPGKSLVAVSDFEFDMILAVCEVPEEEMTELKNCYPSVIVFRAGCKSCFMTGDTDSRGNRVYAHFLVPHRYEDVYFDAFRPEIVEKIFG